ncbi:MAG: hypothetical protein ACJAVI_000011 [Candidatus Azotimanducaceae bacterium]|jgi:hypothetical protein
MKKIILWILGIVFTLFAAVMILQMVASERVEVIQMKTLNAEGKYEETRLWIVDDDGKQYVRASADSGWYQRMKVNPEVLMTRNDQEIKYLAVEKKSKMDVMNQLMNDKYTWGDDVIGFMMGRADAIPMELQPL